MKAGRFSFALCAREPRGPLPATTCPARSAAARPHDLPRPVPRPAPLAVAQWRPRLRAWRLVVPASRCVQPGWRSDGRQGHRAAAVPRLRPGGWFAFREPMPGRCRRPTTGSVAERHSLYAAAPRGPLCAAAAAAAAPAHLRVLLDDPLGRYATPTRPSMPLPCSQRAQQRGGRTAKLAQGRGRHQRRQVKLHQRKLAAKREVRERLESPPSVLHPDANDPPPNTFPPPAERPRVSVCREARSCHRGLASVDDDAPRDGPHSEPIDQPAECAQSRAVAAPCLAQTRAGGFACPADADTPADRPQLRGPRHGTRAIDPRDLARH